MESKTPVVITILLIICSCIIFAGAMFNNSRIAKEEEKALAVVLRIADDLDSKTSDTGAYIKQEVRELDPWGHEIRVTYSKGGLAEFVEVRSAGRDGEMFTNDDFAASRSSVNASGIGTGVKQNIEETAENGSRGFFRGAVEGLKQGIKKKPN